VIVGAHYSGSFKGAAYVYEKNQTTWELTANLTADDGSDFNYFGHSVGVADSTIVVGAQGDESFTGSVYTFQKHAGNWTQMNKITADDGKSKIFGWNVEIDGDIVAVGAIDSVYLNKLLT
jgi:predicted RecA/RadA family phage recombinase